MSGLSLRIVKNTDFSNLYKELLLKNREISIPQQKALLEIAVIMINEGNKDVREFGQRIIVLYSNLFENYVPLYDLALNLGHVPILKSIENSQNFREKLTNQFHSVFSSAAAELYKMKDFYLTAEQRELGDFFTNRESETVSIIAPTSYGKSELIIDYCDKKSEENICIVVPTKALIAQTRKRLIYGLSNNAVKIISHPDMYVSGESGFVAVLTQERLLRLLRKDSSLNFQSVFIDEAHNLLSDDSRSSLLAKTIILLNHRDGDTAFKFLTPFLMNSENLNVRYTDIAISEFKVSERLKSERFYRIDFRDAGSQSLIFYDQYMNESFLFDGVEHENEINFVLNQSSSKNIIYFNSPPKIERFATELAASLNEVSGDDELDTALRDIGAFLDTEYNLIKCIRRGFVYHHGSVPDIIRQFIEHLFSKNKNIKYILSTSTLLEGVNIPAEKLFLFEIKKGLKKLSPPQFKNLVGRVCRFSEIFDVESGSLKLLEPEVYVVGSEYMASNMNIATFLSGSVKADKSISDENVNVLLKEVEIDDENSIEIQQADEFLENMEQGITGKEVQRSTTPVGLSCYLNNVNEIDILENEDNIQYLIDLIPEKYITTPEELITTISNVFITYISAESRSYAVLTRLKESAAMKFYSMLLGWKMSNTPFSQMIASTMTYWDSFGPNELAYVDKWGDEIRGDGYRKLWTKIKGKSRSQRINLAIVRIKEEQDFLDNFLMKFTDVLYELDKIDEHVYLHIKYGTEDPATIALLQNGLSASLSKLLLDKYRQFISIDMTANKIDVDSNVLSSMQEEQENTILIFEARMHCR